MLDLSKELPEMQVLEDAFQKEFGADPQIALLKLCTDDEQFALIESMCRAYWAKGTLYKINI